MKAAMIIAFGVFFTLVACRLTTLLSPDAIAIALGLFIGVFASVPSMALVLLARRRDDEDDWQPTIIEYPARKVDAYPTTPYYKPARRRGIGEPQQLPDRRAEIGVLRSALAYLEGQEVESCHHP